MDLYTEIKEHFDSVYPQEGCGLITVMKGKKQWVPITNIAEDKDDFLMDSEQYLKYFLSSDIIGIVHNHIGESSEPGETDIEACNTMGIPYYIFSYPDMGLTVVQPKNNTTSLFGREYFLNISKSF